jgi:A/G-specific adenine glycosylase
MSAPSARERQRALELAPLLLSWHASSGRHDLPWQRERSLYQVWISEIMLQQTQVTTVIGYFERFMARFPQLRMLADAPIDEVLHLWTGLGYYARARNLHRAAQRVRDEYGGEFPAVFEQVADLPGIGRSTAGAILALATGARHPILDGNVKRALTRVFGIEGDPKQGTIAKRLWALAEAATPQQHVATYTQAIMDLGATVCTPRRPACPMCPWAEPCSAQRTGRQHELPTRVPRDERKARPARRVFTLVAIDAQQQVLLERRPATGIWGGLWSLPEFESESAAHAFAEAALHAARIQPKALGSVQHAFTHFDLEIVPVLAECEGVAAGAVMEAERTLWYDVRGFDEPGARIGLPAPIKALLESLSNGIR